jgi:hypothetical protein
VLVEDCVGAQQLVELRPVRGDALGPGVLHELRGQLIIQLIAVADRWGGEPIYVVSVTVSCFLWAIDPRSQDQQLHQLADPRQQRQPVLSQMP